MGRLQFLLVVPLLLASLFVITPAAIPRAHATTGVGLVCIAVDGNAACPVSPALVSSSPSLPNTVRVGIVVNSSAGLDGFDITVLADHTILKPWKVDLTNSILAAPPVIFLECVGGVLKSSSGTCATTDTVDTIHLTATSVLGAPLTASPTTGLLFTAVYNATSTAVSTPITFQTGCSNTSVSGSVCVTIANGSPTPDQETVQTGRFTDTAYFNLESAFGVASLTVAKGDTDTSLFLNVSIINGFSGTVSLTASVPSPGPTLVGLPRNVKVNSTFPNSALFSCCQVNVTIPTSLSPGQYLLNFTGSSSSSCAPGPSCPPNSFSLPLNVPTPDVSIASNPSSSTFNVTQVGTTTVTIGSIANFAGKVNVTLNTPTGLNASFQNGLQLIQLTLAAKGSASANLRLNSTIYGVYGVNITATFNITTTSGPLSHRITVPVKILDFTLSALAKPLSVPLGASQPEVINFVGSSFPYSVWVTITQVYTTQLTVSGPISPSTGISATCSPTLLHVTNSTSNEEISPSTCTVTGNQIGNYTVTVIGTAARVSHAIAFSVVVVGSDFTMTPSTFIQQVSVGSSATMNLMVAATKQGFNGDVTLTSVYVGNPSSPPSVTISPVKVKLNSTATNGNATLTITALDSTPTGTYYLTVTGNTHTVTIAIVVSSTTSPHDLSIDQVTPSTTSATVGSSITLTILVHNVGKANETSTVVAIAGDLDVASQNVTLAPGQTETVTLTWNTAGYAAGAYMVGAKVLGVTGETILSNNLYRYATPVTLTSSNTSVLQSPYFVPSIIGAVVVVAGILSFIFLQARRKPATPTTP